MNANRVAILADEVDASIGRQLIVRHQIVDGDGAILARKVIGARVERLDVRDFVLTAADENCDLEKS